MPDEPIVVGEAAGARRAQPSRARPRGAYAPYTAGLADYRSRLYEKALGRVRRSREVNETAPTFIYRDTYRALTWLVEAMAQARLGRAIEAREALARAEGVMAGRFPTEGSGDLYPEPWQEWAHCEIIRREARAVVEDAAFPADPFAF